MDRRQHLRLVALVLWAVSYGVAAGVFDSLSGGKPGGERSFLDPEIAFVFSHDVDGGALVLNWRVEPGYYLYRDKFALHTDTPGVEVRGLVLPDGEMKDDPEFGLVAIYPYDVDIGAAIDAGSATNADFTVTYQGCADEGICYPPIRKTFSLALDALVPGAAAAPAAPPETGVVQSADAIAARLADRSLFATAATFFVFGLLLAFTPCVFPLVPILSGIIVGHGERMSTRRGLGLSAIYVFAVAATYAAVGLVAGLFGHNLQATFQEPWVIVSFSAVFVALAFAMFGFYELQLPAALQTRLDGLSRTQRGGSIAGVAAMGVLSAIIVGPCVAPPLAGALIYLGHQGSALTGGTALFALGLGMGMPLLAVGASAGRWLPRAGAWMETVKRVFGVMLLGVAIWFLERILPGPLTLALWAVLLIVCAVYIGALDALTGADRGWRRFGKGAGLAMLCYGVVLVVGAGAGANNPFYPLEPLAAGRGGAESELPFEAVKGVEGFEAGLARARASGRPVMLDFYADWCIECKHLERETFRHADVRAALKDMVLLRADVTANDAEDRALLKRFDLFGPPAVLFFDESGEERRGLRVLGFVGPADFSIQLAALQ